MPPWRVDALAWASPFNYRAESQHLEKRTLKKVIPVVSLLLALIACSQPAGDQPGVNALPPQYLKVSQFQSCLAIKKIGSYEQWCMPVSKSDSCPSESWNQLNELQGNDKVPSCQ
jgi:hypothetical protein